MAFWEPHWLHRGCLDTLFRVLAARRLRGSNEGRGWNEEGGKDRRQRRDRKTKTAIRSRVVLGDTAAPSPPYSCVPLKGALGRQRPRTTVFYGDAEVSGSPKALSEESSSSGVGKKEDRDGGSTLCAWDCLPTWLPIEKKEGGERCKQDHETWKFNSETSNGIFVSWKSEKSRKCLRGFAFFFFFVSADFGCCNGSLLFLRCRYKLLTCTFMMQLRR